MKTLLQIAHIADYTVA